MDNSQENYAVKENRPNIGYKYLITPVVQNSKKANKSMVKKEKVNLWFSGKARRAGKRHEVALQVTGTFVIMMVLVP